MPARIGEFGGTGARGGQAEFEVVEDRDEALEEGGVGILHRVLLFARGAFAEILEIRLAAQREVAEALEVGLQLLEQRLLAAASASAVAASAGLGWSVGIGGFVAHFLRITIKVMSSCCG